MVYAARNRGGRILSPRVADATAAMLAHKPLVRFSLHPPDARYPELVRHIQQVLERLLASREAVNKLDCAHRLDGTSGAAEAADAGLTSHPRSHPASGPDSTRQDHTVHNAALRPSC